MKENKWQWSGSEKEFLELIRWAIIFRMLCTEKKSGWMKIAFNKDKVDSIAEELGITEYVLAEEMQKIGQNITNSIHKAQIERAFDRALEDIIYTQIREGCIEILQPQVNDMA